MSRLDPADPVLGEDGLPVPPEPFATPRWFVVLIASAAVLAVVLGAPVLAGRR